MKELVIMSTEVKEENENRYSKIIRFTFEAIGWWNTDTRFDKEKDKEFLEAFRNKFGIKIPAV